MRERKYVKFRVDMCEDTKFKIIDMKPERDVVHYVWTRIVLLAGKTNCEGELYMSKNIPYTIETLAIEFNRNIDQVKLALDVFMELEMIEVNEDNVYIVKNFPKHQNIKAKEKIGSKKRAEKAKNEEVKVIKNPKGQSKIDDSKGKYKNDESENKVNQNQAEISGNDIGKDKLDTHNKNIAKVDKNIISNKDGTNSENKIPSSLEKNKRKKTNTNKKKEFDIDVAEEAPEDNRLFFIYDSEEEKPLEEGESVVSEWAY